jgi:hypothetical protein
LRQNASPAIERPAVPPPKTAVPPGGVDPSSGNLEAERDQPPCPRAHFHCAGAG